MIVAVPATTAVNVTEHVPDVNVQLAPTVPTAVLDEVKLTLPPGTLCAFVVSATATAHVEVAPGLIMLGLHVTLVEVLSFADFVTVTVAAELVLVLCVPSPPYAAVTEPVPAVTPVNVTKQLPDDRVHVVALNAPPVVPAVRVNVTVPVGKFVGVVVSVTVAVTLAEQLVAPIAMLQLTFGTVVEVLSLTVLVTVTVAATLLLVL